MVANFLARRDLRASLALVAVGVAYLAYAARYPMDTLATPGPGIFPRAVGALVAALAAWQAVRAALAQTARRSGEAHPPGSETADGAPPDADEWKPMLMVAIIVVYLLVVSGLGFLVSTGILVVACSKLMATPGWRSPVLLALGAALSCYVIFEVWLKVPLPRGFLI
jgi:hypothetical protein